jgi:hypothetical protein
MRTINLPLLFFCCFIIFTSHAYSQSSDTPRLEIEKSSHNFGNISEGEKVTHIFKLKNVGKSSLTIKNVKGT